MSGWDAVVVALCFVVLVWGLAVGIGLDRIEARLRKLEKRH